MKHEWQQPVYKNPVEGFFRNERECKHCGKRQELHEETAWMRVISRRWMPLVGRCTGNRKIAAR
jgi:hypothetical protein